MDETMSVTVATICVATVLISQLCFGFPNGDEGNCDSVSERCLHTILKHYESAYLRLAECLLLKRYSL